MPIDADVKDFLGMPNRNGTCNSAMMRSATIGRFFDDR